MDEANLESRGVAGNVQLGLNVWLFEAKWLLKGLAHGWQRRQLGKRLAEEHELLGRQAMGSSDDAAMDQARKQAAFLEDEIRRLDKEHDAKREFERSRKLQEWGLD